MYIISLLYCVVLPIYSIMSRMISSRCPRQRPVAPVKSHGILTIFRVMNHFFHLAAHTGIIFIPHVFTLPKDVNFDWFSCPSIGLTLKNLTHMAKWISIFK